MKKIMLFIVLFSVSFTTPIFADIYKYVDKDGKSHYVTNKDKVPAQYQNQLDESLDLPPLSKTEKVDWDKKIDTSKTYEEKPAQTKKVSVYVAPDCSYCIQIEKLLKKHKVQYTRYDISSDTTGQKRFAYLEGTGTPLIEIDNEIIRGYDPDRVKSSLGLK